MTSPPNAAAAPPLDPATESFIASLLARMSVEERLGQLVSADAASVTPEEVRSHHLGAVIDSGAPASGDTDLADPETRLRLADEFWLASSERGEGLAGVPALFGMDGARGAAGTRGAVIFPDGNALAATGDAALARRTGRIAAREIRIGGQEWSTTTALPAGDPELRAAWQRGMQGAPEGGSLLEGPYVLTGGKLLPDSDPANWRKRLDALLASVRGGSVAMESINAGAAAMLRAKARLGLFGAPRPSRRYLAGRFDLLSAGEHKSVAREAVRRSLVLLKDNGVLPLHPAGRLLVAGEAAADITAALGPWTSPWRGEAAERRFPYARTVYYGLRQAMRVGGGEAEYSLDGSYGARPDAAVVVIAPDDRGAGLAQVARLKSERIPTVALLLGDAPPAGDAIVRAADAAVLAWLPGSEGGGVADLLIGNGAGEPRWRFTGKIASA